MEDNCAVIPTKSFCTECSIPRNSPPLVVFRFVSGELQGLVRVIEVIPCRFLAGCLGTMDKIDGIWISNGDFVWTWAR